MRPLSWFAGFASFFCTLPLLAQTPGPTPDPADNFPRARVMDVKEVPSGGLIFALRIHSANKKALELSRPPKRRNPNLPRELGDDDRQPFSLAGSTLKDLYTDVVYPCSDVLPLKPFLGPMEVTATLAPGGWVQLAVAFPKTPPPPPEKDGKKQPYKLLFEIPELKIRTELKLDPETLKPLTR
jgi:hypothetical protein